MVEIKAMKHSHDHKVTKFLYEEIFTRYDVPRELVIDQGSQFTSNLIIELMKEYNIKHRKSIPYNSQVNGQAEVTNQEIEAILTKKVHLHPRDWSSRLPKLSRHIAQHARPP